MAVGLFSEYNFRLGRLTVSKKNKADFAISIISKDTSVCLGINKCTCLLYTSKGASAKWAFETMNDRTVGMLKDNSEYILQDNIDRNLYWCDEFVRQLDLQADISEESCLLRDIAVSYTHLQR